MHHHGQDQAQRIDNEVSFAPLDPLVRIKAGWTACFRRLDALRVDDRRTGIGQLAGTNAYFLAEHRVNATPGAVTRPFPEVVIDMAPEREIRGQHAPLGPSTVDIEDSIDDSTQINGAFTASTRWLGQKRRDDRPFMVADIAGVPPSPPI